MVYVSYDIDSRKNNISNKCWSLWSWSITDVTKLGVFSRRGLTLVWTQFPDRNWFNSWYKCTTGRTRCKDKNEIPQWHFSSIMNSKSLLDPHLETSWKYFLVFHILEHPIYFLVIGLPLLLLRCSEFKILINHR